jgi:S1-C subfamily serine protease
VVGYDRTRDLAVLQLSDASGLATLTLGDTPRPSVGTPVTAIGNAGGVGGKPSTADGKVTALNQTITATDSGTGSSESLSGLIAVNADLQPGDSGGPLVDQNGNVLGVDTAASVGYQFEDGSQGGQSGPQGYAIPAAQARTTAEAIAAQQASATVHIGPTAFLGVSISTGSTLNGTPGAQIVGLLPEGPALSLGLGQGDVITALDGHRIDSATALTEQLDQHHPGDQTTVSWTDSAGAQHVATATLGTGPAG